MTPQAVFFVGNRPDEIGSFERTGKPPRVIGEPNSLQAPQATLKVDADQFRQNPLIGGVIGQGEISFQRGFFATRPSLFKSLKKKIEVH
jgi:hypothetical protein